MTATLLRDIAAIAALNARLDRAFAPRATQRTAPITTGQACPTCGTGLAIGQPYCHECNAQLIADEPNDGFWWAV